MQRELVPLHTIQDLLAIVEMLTGMMESQTDPLTTGTQTSQLTLVLTLVMIGISRVQVLDQEVQSEKMVSKPVAEDEEQEVDK